MVSLEISKTLGYLIAHKQFTTDEHISRTTTDSTQMKALRDQFQDPTVEEFNRWNEEYKKKTGFDFGYKQADTVLIRWKEEDRA
ncbi:hypothetical protein Focb16_v005988 [Fusarium oxysporum f. sp. cubense]|uniref:Uncharacterized protein n=1 Tax=Fusarium oxysporum f. sp. cubense TaxID=61366 RepID=A0A559LIN9_FUSOC|nr:hypothetical protein Focb16_v005988 [Fusarium oxysporum f. sp. cubense]